MAMKNIIINVLIATFCLSFVACSDDDNKTHENVLAVTSSDLTFTAMPSEGTIRLNMVGASVSTGADWCTAEISDSVVTVSVTTNNNISARSTAVIVAYADEQVFVPVVQQGITVTASSLNLLFTFDGGADTIDVYCNYSYEVETSDDWITATIADNNQIIVTADANASGDREGAVSIIVENGAKKLDVKVYQDKKATYDDFVGTWQLSGYDLNGTFVTFALSVEPLVEGETYSVYGWSGSGIDEAGFPFVMNYTEEDGLPMVYIKGAQDLGVLNDTYGIWFTGMVRYGTDVVFITGNYVCMSGSMEFDTVDWELNSVTLSDDKDYDFIGMRYMLEMASGWGGFPADASYPVDKISMEKVDAQNKSAVATALHDKLVPAIAMAAKKQ